MASAKKTPKKTRMLLQKLQPHPLQADFYEGSSASENEALAADLRANGQRDPLHVMPPHNKAGLPAHTILDGHRRAEAMRADGETEAEVVVRCDLADADAAAVEMIFLDFNVNRRQLHPLDKARIVLRQYEIEKNRPHGKLRQREENEARDRIGQRIGMSGRNLQRYFRVLLTPIEVQRAVRDGKLPLVQGEKVEGLSNADRAEIAERIQQGEPPKAIVQEYIGRPNRKHRKSSDALVAFARSLQRGLEDLDGRVDRPSGRLLQEYRPVFERAQQVLEELIARSKL